MQISTSLADDHHHRRHQLSSSEPSYNSFHISKIFYVKYVRYVLNQYSKLQFLCLWNNNLLFIFFRSCNPFFSSWKEFRRIAMIVLSRMILSIPLKWEHLGKSSCKRITLGLLTLISISALELNKRYKRQQNTSQTSRYCA